MLRGLTFSSCGGLLALWAKKELFTLFVLFLGQIRALQSSQFQILGRDTTTVALGAGPFFSFFWGGVMIYFQDFLPWLINNIIFNAPPFPSHIKTKKSKAILLNHMRHFYS